MMAASKIGILHILICIKFINVINAGPLKHLPSRSSAVFYASIEKEGTRVSYRDTADSWTNLPDLFINSKAESPALLCVNGAWLIYGNTDYKAPSDNDVHLFSGTENCIKSSIISKIGSMQPVTPTKFSKSSITIFSKKNFASWGVTFTKEDNPGIEQLRAHLSNIGSLVVVGTEEWSLMSSNGRIMCVRPRPNEGVKEPIPICYALDLENVKIADFLTAAVIPGCPEEHHDSIIANLRVTDCKQFGVEDVVTLQIPGARGRSLQDVLECKKNLTLDKAQFTEEQSKLILDMIKLRLTHNFDSTEQLLWPDKEEDIWKTLALDTIFDIVTITVPSDIVNIPYMHVIREFAVWHLNEVWKELSDTVRESERHEWRRHRVIIHLLGKCLKAATLQQLKYENIISADYQHKSTLDEFVKRIHPNFKMNKDWDPVLETTFLAVNYAMALCHELLEYRYNFWDSYVTTVQKLYLKPLQSRWQEPSQIPPKAFKAILSGFGTDIQYKKMAYATTIILELTPNLEALPKPKAKKQE